MRLNFDMDRGQYTQQLSDLIWEQYSAENSYHDDYRSVLGMLGDSTVFRPFSDRILCFINELYGTLYSSEEAAKVVLKKSTESGVKLNRNTVLNWFAGKTQPKKGQPDRERMFALAFLLSLDIPQTIELFQKVLLERAYNLRNINDFIYLFGQLHKMSYAETMALIEKAETTLVSETEESINDTQQLLDDLAALPGEKSLLEYIASHSRAFSIGKSSAKSEYIRLLLKAKDDLSGREYWKRVDSFDNSIITSMEGRTQGSLDFMLYVIKGQDWLQNSETDSSFYKSLFSYEISNDFPDRSTLNDNVTSSYILRKNIIFLSFYIYWVQMYLEGDKYGIDECDCYDEFRSSMNKRLMDCGFSPLYPGNPYDWLFLYCSAAATDTLTPLDIFRGIMATS